MCECGFRDLVSVYSKSLSNRPPPQIDHSPISIDLCRFQTIACNHILTPYTDHLLKQTI